MVCEERFGRESDGEGIEKGRRVEEYLGDLYKYLRAQSHESQGTNHWV
jgi:hypothetical protein